MSQKNFETLKSIEQLNQQKNCWILDKNTARFLQILINILKPQKALELGTGIGYSGIHIAEAMEQCRQAGGQECPFLYTIESHKERFELAKKYFEGAGLSEKIRQIKGHAPEVIPDEKFDFVLFDATKEEHILYLQKVIPLLSEKGIIVVDNTETHAKELKSFFQYVEKLSDFWQVKLKIGAGVMVIGKKGK